jgi:hypothetical protein
MVLSVYGYKSSHEEVMLTEDERDAGMDYSEFAKLAYKQGSSQNGMKAVRTSIGHSEKMYRGGGSDYAL